MQQLIPVPEETSQRFSEVAQKARMYWHMVNATGDPTPSSNFAQSVGRASPTSRSR